LYLHKLYKLVIRRPEAFVTPIKKIRELFFYLHKLYILVFVTIYYTLCPITYVIGRTTSFTLFFLPPKENIHFIHTHTKENSATIKLLNMHTSFVTLLNTSVVLIVYSTRKCLSLISSQEWATFHAFTLRFFSQSSHTLFWARGFDCGVYHGCG